MFDRKRAAVAVVMALAAGLAGCSAADDTSASGSEATATDAAVSEWPASLTVVGDGFPTAGAPCRRIGESAATVNYLDDSASLVGCKVQADAEALGGKVLTVIDGITLVSVPNGPSTVAVSSDAKVAGTDYNATAEIPCAGFRGQPMGKCQAGVKRNGEGGVTTVEVQWPGGGSRALFFDQQGKFISADTNQADGSAAYKIGSKRDGDLTTVSIGPERYEIVDAFILGG